ncbi:MAG TPA: TonB family protein [Ohtaekwangia sp.]
MKVLICAVMFFVMTSVNGQDLIMQYFDRTGNAVDKKEDSHFYVIGKQMLFLETAQGKLDTVAGYVDTVNSYYTASDVLRSREVYNGDGILQGEFLTFYENGIPMTKTTFFDGRRIGYFMSWYSTGKPHSVTQFHKDAGHFSPWPDNDFKIVNYWDSKGKKIVDNGEGFCDCYFRDDNFHEKGKVKGGLRDSLWTGYSGDVLLFNEHYTQGALVRGERFYKDHKQEYFSFDTKAEYRSGPTGMYAFINRNLKYPSNTGKPNVQGSVFVQFVVERDGTLTEFQVVQGVDPALDNEALRVLKMMPPWTPALQRGEAVRTKFIVPVKFIL